jgi:hypothetical protein
MEISNHMIELLGAFITGVVGPVSYLLIEKYLAKRKQKKIDPIAEGLRETQEINSILEKIQEEFNADRVWISQFHNGGNFYPTGKSIQKFSVFYETVKPGVANIAHIFSNIPCSLYPKAFEHMLKNKSIFLDDYNTELAAQLGMTGSGQVGGNKSSYLLPIFCVEGKYIGTLGMDYVKKKRILSKDEWEHFQIYNGRLSGYLSHYLNGK